MMSKPSILMIEDDLPTLELYRGILEMDYEVLSRCDETGILELLARETPHAIILEPAMKRGTGWNILATLHTVIREQPIPIIVCTTLDDRKRGLEMGAAEFLTKPVLPNLLLQTLHQLPNGNS